MVENKVIRVFHLADTHLGFSAYRKLDPDGINQREKDIYETFTSIVDYIIDSRPDLVIHAGDLFDSVRPTNRAISVALEQLIRLSKASIPTIIISGNHETPKLRETGHIFRLFEHLDNIYPVYKDVAEIHYFDIKGKKIAVHAVPHCREQKQFTEILKGINPDPSVDYNILVTHGAVQSIREFRMNEFNEYIIPISLIEKKFDYVALGHFHRYVIIQDGIVYSGSIERMSFSEANEDKGIIELNLSLENNRQSLSFHSFPTRAMIDIEPIDCKDLSPKEINERISEVSAKIESRDAIIRLTLLNLDQSTYRSLDSSFIKSLFPNHFHLEIRHTSSGEQEDASISYAPTIGDLSTEFERYVEKLSHRRKKVILKFGMEYIRKAQAEGK